MYKATQWLRSGSSSNIMAMTMRMEDELGQGRQRQYECNVPTFPKSLQQSAASRFKHIGTSQIAGNNASAAG